MPFVGPTSTALAVIVFELLTGRRPFVSDSWLDLLEMHYSTPPPAPRSLDPDIPEAVEQAILKGLEKDPNRRYSTCTELAIALGCQFLTGPAPFARILLETEIPRMGGRWKSVVYPFAIRQPLVHLALAPDALWAIHRSELMRWPLAMLHDLHGRGFRGLSFRIRGVAGKDMQWLRFKRRKEARRWRETIASLIPSVGELGPSAAGPPVDQGRSPEAAIAPDPRVEPVVLLAGRPAARFQLLGMVEARGRGKRRAEDGLAIRAAMMGADAVVDLNAERLPGLIRTEHRASGTAVRVVNAEGRLELKSRWFDRQIARIGVPMMVLAILGLLVGVRIETGTAGVDRPVLLGSGRGRLLQEFRRFPDVPDDRHDRLAVAPIAATGGVLLPGEGGPERARYPRSPGGRPRSWDWPGSAWPRCRPGRSRSPTMWGSPRAS